MNESAAGFFPQLIYALRAADAIRRDELVEQLDCGLETVNRGIKLLKRFNLLDSTKDGYVKKPSSTASCVASWPRSPAFLTASIVRYLRLSLR